MSGQYHGCIKSKRSFRKKKSHLSLYSSKRRRLAAKRKSESGVAASICKHRHISTECGEHLTFTHVEQEYYSESDQFVDVENFEGNESAAVKSSSVVEDISFSYSSPDSQGDILLNAPVTTEGSHRSSEDIFLESCIDKLCDRAAVASLVHNLNDKHMLQHFMNLFEVLSQGKMSALEIPVLLCLERATFQTLSSTCQMKFHPLTKKFFRMGYKLFGNSFLEFCSGPKSYGQITTKQAVRGKFNPELAKVNFCVPHRRHLKDRNHPFHKEIYPGIIEESLKMVEGRTDMILMLDGKKLSRGLRPNFGGGDIDLWNLEKPKSLPEVQEQLEAELDQVERYSVDFVQAADARKISIVEGAIKLLSGRTREIRHQQLQVKKRLAYNVKKNQQGGVVKRYQYAISACKTYLYSMYLWMENAVKVIGQLCLCNAMIQGNAQQFNMERTCDLASADNIRILHSPDILHETLKCAISSMYVKQRSQEWHRLRRNAVVTGSTAYAALGLRSLADMEAHFDEFVFKTGVRQFSAEQRQNMQYGADNEIHAIGSMVSIVLRAMLPSCATLVECGSFFLDGRVRNNFLEVSPDGLIIFDHSLEHCICNSNLNPDHDNIAVEYKCIVPGTYKLPVAYKCPEYHVFQILLEMFVTGTGLLWLCFYNKQSMTIIECDFDEELCRDILNTLATVFDKDPIERISHASQIRKQFKPRLEEYVLMYTRFLGEFPVVPAVVGPLYLCSNPFNPYHIGQEVRKKQYYDEMEIISEAASAWKHMKQSVEDAVELLRNEATELLAFVMTNSLRLHKPDEVPNIPIAYALRGESLSVETVRIMWHRVLEACYQQRCSVLCTVVDGQFLNLATRHSDGKPLSRLQLMKQCWSDSAKLNKKELISLIMACEQPPFHYPWHWVRTPCKPEIWLKHQRQLLKKQKSHNKQKEVIEELNSSDVMLLLEGTKYGRRLAATQKDQIFPGLVPYAVDSQSESDSEDSDDPDYHLLNSSISSFSSITDTTDGHTESEVSDNDSFVQDETPHHYHPCLHSILNLLKSKGREERWGNVSITELANYKLGSPAQIRKLYLYELDIIRDAIKSSFGKTIFVKKTLTHVKYRKVIDVFCPTSASSMAAITEGRILLQSIPKLQTLCRRFLMKPTYPKEFLQIVACKVSHSHKVKLWENDSPIDLQVHVDGTDFIHELFCYPEWNEHQNRLQFITLDPSHSLTNLRAQICKHSFRGVSRHAFLAVSEYDNSILCRAFVTDILDKQSVEVAMKFFSQAVETVLHELGYFSEARFVGLVRKWYESCDSRGILPTIRYRQLQDMFEYLEAKVDYSDYPPPTQYIEGIPIRTFESLMHGISTRFALLSHCEKAQFAARAIGTLGIETWFSTISRMEFSSLGCPKACDIPRLIAKLVEINSVKHDPGRGFHFDTTQKNVYPYHLMETDVSMCSGDEDVGDGNIDNVRPNSYKSWFDKPRVRSKCRKKVKSIAGLREITKGTQPVREFHKIDESKILHQHRAHFTMDYDSILDMV